MSKEMSISAFVISLFVLTGTVSMHAQDERAKVAQSYEQSGDYRSSARLWQALYSENPTNDAYFFGVVRSLKSMNNFASLLDIVQDKLKRKRTAKVLVVYAQVLAKSQRMDEANSAWEEARNMSGADVNTYSEIAYSQTELQLFDKAILTLILARKHFGKPALFADELAQLYASQGDYKNGIQEVLQLFFATSNLQQAEGRLSAFMLSDTATRYLRDKMREVADEHDDNYLFLRLFEWFHRETKQYADAFEVVRKIDQLLSSRGRELLIFAEQCRMDGQYEIAIRAYSAILAMGKKQDVAQSATYGYALCMESRFRENTDTPTDDELKAVLNIYRDLIQEYPHSSTSADAQLHIARIQNQFFRNVPDAIRDYRVVIDQYSGSFQAAQASVELASIYVAQEDLPKATEMFSQTISLYEARAPKQAESAQYLLAEVYFYQNKLDAALEIYNKLMGVSESEYANDAIDRLTTINLNRSDSLLLSLLAKATLRSLQRKYDEALALLRELSSQNKNIDLAEQALLRAAELQFTRKNYVETRSLVQQLSTLNKESIYGDKAMLIMANSFAAENNRAEALRCYEDLLNRFPRSLYIQDAREKIRKIRAAL